MTIRLRLTTCAAAAVSVSLTARPEPLPDRYKQAACSIVHIISDEKSGTGFFINPTTVVTAAHVLTDLVDDPGNPGNKRVVHPSNFLVTLPNGNGFEEHLPSIRPNDLSNLHYDLLVIPTDLTSRCYLTVGTSVGLQVGTNLIGLGFPVTASTPVLYQGFVSGRGADFRTDQADLIRVQMPITPGASGGPIIGDDDKVVGVIDAEPLQFPDDVRRLADAYSSGNAAIGNYQIGGVDLNKAIGEITFTITQDVAAGSGFAVPIEYLKQ